MSSMASFLLMLREGVEAALIVAILLAYVDRVERTDQRRWIWLGTLAAVAVALLAGALLWLTIGELTGTAEKLVEGGIALAAAGLLTWMIFWMGRQAHTLRDRLEMSVDVALTVGGALGLASIAFVAVLREGLESALFLISTTLGGSGIGQLAGALLGLGGAAAIGYAFYRGAGIVDLRRFFRITGILIVVFAAGLVATAVHEFQELGVIPTYVEHLYRLDVLDPSTSILARFLESLFGWRHDPSLLTFLAYFAYLVPVGWAFLRMTRPAHRTSIPASSQQPTDA